MLYVILSNNFDVYLKFRFYDQSQLLRIRMKQNKFPVLFLTNGITNKWKPYKDARCKNTQVSLNYAKAECLHVRNDF